ncbi:hypothetical protein JYT31_00480 [Beggiatoa alba]|nr:hypothetical protein [Beggiatoa alba]
MRKLVRFIVTVVVFISLNTYAENKEAISLVPQDNIKGIHHKRASSLSAISAILNQDEVKVSKTISSFYASMQEKKTVLSDSVFAKYAIVLKNILPLVCADLEYQKDNEKVIDSLISGISKQEKLFASSINSDLHVLKNERHVDIPNQVFAVLIMSKMACNGISSGYMGNEVESVINRAGYQLGTAAIRDGSNSSNEFLEMAAKQFGSTVEEWEEEKKKELKELKDKGFLEVDDAKIGDLESYYNQNKGSLKSIDEVKEQLAFFPSNAVAKGNYEFLGATAAGVVTDSGYSSIGTIYDTPIGKISIHEEDLVVANGFTSVEPEYLNIKIGKHKASLILLKGKENGKFKTEIYWNNPVSNREYTVDVNINLNDPAIQEKREELLNFLADSYGEY